MVIYKKIILSLERPEIDNGIWLKPVGDTIEMNLIEGGQVKPIGGDGAALKNEIIGTASDSASDLTLLGLNKLINQNKNEMREWVIQQLENFKYSLEHPENHPDNP